MQWNYQGMAKTTEKQLAAYVTEDVHRRFRIRAARLGLSMSQLLKRLVDNELAKEADSGQ